MRYIPYSASSANYFHSCLTLCDLLIIAYQAPLSMGFSRQEYWSGLPFFSLGGLPDSGIEPVSLTPPTLADGFFILVPPGKPIFHTGIDLPVYIPYKRYINAIRVQKKKGKYSIEGRL